MAGQSKPLEQVIRTISKQLIREENLIFYHYFRKVNNTRYLPEIRGVVETIWPELHNYISNTETVSDEKHGDICDLVCSSQFCLSNSKEIWDDTLAHKLIKFCGEGIIKSHLLRIDDVLNVKSSTLVTSKLYRDAGRLNKLLCNHKNDMKFLYDAADCFYSSAKYLFKLTDNNSVKLLVNLEDMISCLKIMRKNDKGEHNPYSMKFLMRMFELSKFIGDFTANTPETVAHSARGYLHAARFANDIAFYGGRKKSAETILWREADYALSGRAVQLAEEGKKIMCGAKNRFDWEEDQKITHHPFSDAEFSSLYMYVIFSANRYYSLTKDKEVLNKRNAYAKRFLEYYDLAMKTTGISFSEVFSSKPYLENLIKEWAALP